MTHQASQLAGTTGRAKTDTLRVVGADLLQTPRAPQPTPRLSRHGIRPYLVAADLLALAAAGIVVQQPGAMIVFAAAVVFLNATGAFYRSHLTLSVLEQTSGLALRALAAVGVVIGTAAVTPVRAPIGTAFTAAVVYLLDSLALRTCLYGALRAMRRRGRVAHKTLILGAGQVGQQVATALIDHPEYGLNLVGFVDSEPFLETAPLPVPVLGGLDDLADVVTSSGARQVIVAFAARPSSSMVDIIRTCDRLDCELFIVPRLFELHDSSGDDVEVVWGIPLLRLRKAPFRRPSWRLKRLLDVVVAASLLVLFAPLLALCALAVRWETGPGVLFRQERVGLDGRFFTLLKFRSLRPDDDAESMTLWNITDDDRVGRIGRLLRRFSLDELPQLWNVLRGDMSIVGPRPERPHFVDQFATAYPRYMARHRVPCGMTGWAQIHGLRGDTSVGDRARFDNYYIENWSLGLDLRIVLRTVGAVLAGTGR